MAVTGRLCAAHFHEYDELLAEGYDTDSARHFVAARIDKILQTWGVLVA